MTRPTELPRPGLRALRDAEVPDFLDAAPVALLAMLDLQDGACQRFLPRLALLVERHGVPGGYVDTATDRLVAEALGVRSVPTTLVFVAGEVVDRLMGSPPDAVLDEALRARRG